MSQGTVALRAAQVIDWTGSAPAGVSLNKVYIGEDSDGLGGIQVATATVEKAPTRGLLDKLFLLRRGNRAVTLVVVVTDGARSYLFGPDPQGAIVELAAGQAVRQLQSVLEEPDSTAAFNRMSSLRRQVESGGVGWTNSGLFAKYHLENNVPARADWASRGEQGKLLLGLRGQRLIESLGFRLSPGPGGTLLLLAASGESDMPRAVAVLLDESEHFDTKSSRYQLTPIAFGLAVAQRRELPWVIGLQKDHIRLYPGKDGIGVGQKGQVETFFEIDLSAVDDVQSALLTLVFSAEALARKGTTDELLRDSARYATGLSVRLRHRIYEEVVPPIAKAVAERLPSIGLEIDANGLQTAYKLTLRILFRLLFQAYAEDRGLLPFGRNEGYTANSLKTIAHRNLDVDEADFGEAASIWFDLGQVWNAIDQGNKQWQVPAYNGGLFSTEAARSEEGALLARLSLPDSVLGPALQHLLVDETNEHVRGPVDFRALSVREFGTIYEGLLESSLSLADADLTEDRNGAWVPAGAGDSVKAATGAVYFHGASGERKATGSYFTPKVIVDHLVERSVVPVLTTHLNKIANNLAKGDVVSRTEFFDFRVADLAMGSGHFLVAAVDKIEALMRTFLTEHDVPDVRQELLTIANVAREALGTDEVAKSEVEEIGLLRRQIARRCIYGLDINPLAVELARLALWIHTFVPGLPMSNLDHGLVCANSLTGIGTIDEAIDSLVGSPEGRGVSKGAAAKDDGLFGGLDTTRHESGHQLMVRKAVTDYLKESLPLLADVANASEAGKAEVQRATKLLDLARAKAAPAGRIFDAAVAVRLGEWSVSITKEDHVARLVETTVPSELIAPLNPAHMPVLFPEVFVRDVPGFDVLLGNPPWEAPHLKEDRWWNLRFPGLLTLEDDERVLRIASLKTERPDLAKQFQDESADVNRMRSVLVAHRWPGLGSGHVDLYQAFAWRNWELLRHGGRSGIVLPRGAHSGSGLVAWRDEVLELGAFASVCFIENKARWAFDMEPRYTVGLTVIEKTPGSEVGFTGPFTSEKEFLEGSSDIAVVPVQEFREWTDTNAFLLVPNMPSVDVLRVLKQSPRFGAGGIGWLFRPTRGDFLKWATLGHASPESGIPVRGGKSFGLWHPDAAGPRAYVEEGEFRAAYLGYLRSAARNKRSAHFGRKYALDDLPIDRPRVAMRWISRARDTRTAIAALLPPGEATDDSASVMHRLRGSSREEAFVLGVLSSIPFDWQARLLTEMNFTFEVLNQLGVPVIDRSEWSERVVSISGRLAAVDDRYSEWAMEVGVEVGSANDERVQADLIAELDALVSLLYGLTEEQIRHIFMTFHRGWEYQERLEAVLLHYAGWKGVA